ncbi:aspartate/glutamate racemase family protein [Nitratireductor pacificus]|uniref:Asp/Glu racemase n=1 Tax=Nitratireductor pacificus pht-3B TaxID=391937 RepID=K2M9P1_9HYPH|nr:aspartate/glutamate racemase family protein [Nitratireductor pacificus]EKF17715.1 hypothetical protein NA2_16687 [Nitratireductor pacificus pht-3B]
MPNRKPKILVVNPNANAAVTAAMAEALAPLAGAPVGIEARTLEGAPFGIESETDAVTVAPMLAELLRQEGPRYDAFVIGCFLDPGLNACREVAGKPVFGIGECAIYAALTQSDQFGVLALSRASVARHKPIYRRLGVGDRLAGELPLEISVAEAVGDAAVYPRILARAKTLRDEYGAGAVVLGCAGMARHRRALQDALGIAVIDPVQAGASRAVSEILTR